MALFFLVIGCGVTLTVGGIAVCKQGGVYRVVAALTFLLAAFQLGWLYPAYCLYNSVW